MTDRIKNIWNALVPLKVIFLIAGIIFAFGGFFYESKSHKEEIEELEIKHDNEIKEIKNQRKSDIDKLLNLMNDVQSNKAKTLVNETEIKNIKQFFIKN